MKVADLIRILEKLDPTASVVQIRNEFVYYTPGDGQRENITYHLKKVEEVNTRNGKQARLTLDAEASGSFVSRS